MPSPATSPIPENTSPDLAAEISISPERVRDLSSRTRPVFFNREKIDAFCEKGIFGAVLLILFFAPLALGSVRHREFAIVAGIEIVALSLWLVRIFVRDQYRMLWPPFTWGVIAFTAYALFSWQNADVEYLAREELFRIVTYAFFFFLVLDNCNRQEYLQWLLFIPIGVGVFISFYGIFQFFTGHEYVWNYPRFESYKGRGSGTFMCPNHLAGYLEMLVPISLAFLFTGRLKPLSKIFLGYAALVMLAGIAVTISRAGVVAALGGLLALFAVLIRNRDYRIPALLLFGLLLVVGTYSGLKSFRAQQRIAHLANPEREARLQYWKPAIQMWRENIWTGVGPNHYDFRYRAYRHWQGQLRPRYTHNDYLNTLADYGLIGFALVLASLSLAAWGVFRSWKFVFRQNEIATKSSTRSAMVLGCSAGLTALLLHSAADFNMHIPANALLAILLLVVLTAHIRYATERFWVNPGLLGRLLAGLVLLLGITWLAEQSWRFGLEAYYLDKGKVYAVVEPERLEYLKKAHAIQPSNPETMWEIGETLRLLGWKGNEGYQDYLRGALVWFERAAALNPWDPHALAHAGMSFHWLNEPDKATELFERALQLDPKGGYIMTLYGWHLLQQRNLMGAYYWFHMANAYLKGEYPLTRQYLEITERRLAEKAEIRYKGSEQF